MLSAPAPRRRAGVLACLGSLLMPWAVSTVQAGQETSPPGPETTLTHALKVAEGNGDAITLQIATWRFQRDGAPDVELIGVAHIADRSFYQQVQTVLDASDVVLYESVMPAGAGGAGGQTDQERAASTDRALRFLASLVEAYRVHHDTYPPTLEALGAFIAELDWRLAQASNTAGTDGWGAIVRYEVGQDGTSFKLISGGADRADDGDDILVTSDHAVPAAPLGGESIQIQAELASALDLEFQLDAIDYTGTTFRVSDMAIDELEAAMRERDLDFAMLADTLSGTSLTGQVAAVMLRLIRVLDAMVDGAIADTCKVLLIELIGDPTVLEQSLDQFGEGFSEVLIGMRNQVPIDDLASIIEQEPQVETVAILYGAAHLPDLAERLIDQLGYQLVEERWLGAIKVDLATSKIDKRTMMQMRMMVRQMMRAQVRKGPTGQLN
jgi:hypothetical protein